MRSNRSRKKKTRRNKNRRTYRRKSPKKRINRKRYSNKKRTGRRRINRKRRRMLRGGAPCKWVEPLAQWPGEPVKCATCDELKEHLNHIHEFQVNRVEGGYDIHCKECSEARDHLFHRHAFLAGPVPAAQTVGGQVDESRCIKELGGPVASGGLICGKKASDECHQNL